MFDVGKDPRGGLDTVLSTARPRDAMTLWHILQRVEGSYDGRWARFDAPVKTAMTAELHTLQADQTLDALLPVFDRNEVAIIYDGDEFFGLITRIDLINHLRRSKT